MTRSTMDYDLFLDELELLFRRKGHLPVLLVALTVLALGFFVVGILMATGIMLVTFFLFVTGDDGSATEAAAEIVAAVT
ncbi:uncharacterized protein LOC128273185 [Anopheles cruzii]|uniref:uncharacterized protein LOC128273185 n=1 Tax=Anopheles cruzii TaxID=68878 RepID=UPI0022EC56D8|nr:uncharacterized protein LOC128273185 [Anopheles cruzii]